MKETVTFSEAVFFFLKKAILCKREWRLGRRTLMKQYLANKTGFWDIKMKRGTLHSEEQQTDN